MYALVICAREDAGLHGLLVVDVATATGHPQTRCLRRKYIVTKDDVMERANLRHGSRAV